VDFSCSSDCSLIELVLVALYNTKEGKEIVVKIKRHHWIQATNY